MPKLLSSTASTARRMEAVVAVFRVRLRNSALDMTRAARVGRPLIAQEACVAARPPRARRSAARQRLRDPPLPKPLPRAVTRPQPSRSPTRALAIRNQEDR
jgi:hypothetical protein